MSLRGKTVAILVEDIYQDLEVWYPYYRLIEAGATVEFLGTAKENYTGKYGYPLKVHGLIRDASIATYDAVIIPGGYAPDILRRYDEVNRFVAGMFHSGKIVAAICHAGWNLVSAGILKGRRVTSFSAIRDDMTGHGCNWVDEEVVVDGNLITSRCPDDLPAFCREIIRALSE